MCGCRPCHFVVVLHGTLLFFFLYNPFAWHLCLYGKFLANIDEIRMFRNRFHCFPVTTLASIYHIINHLAKAFFLEKLSDDLSFVETFGSLDNVKPSNFPAQSDGLSCVSAEETWPADSPTPTLQTKGYSAWQEF
jgi:hypothetical protein